MMKTVAIVLVCVLAASAPQVWAQSSGSQTTTTPVTEVHAGIGVSLTPSLFVIQLYSRDNAYTPLSNVLIHIPVEFGRHFRFEPAFGHVRLSSDASYESGLKRTASLTNYRIGGGLFYLIRNAGAADGLTVSLGTRLAVINASMEELETFPGMPDDEESWSRSDFLLALCIGAEYYLSKDFSIGGEIQYNHYSIGDEDRTPPSSSPTTYDITYANINGMVTLRWFIW